MSEKLFFSSIPEIQQTFDKHLLIRCHCLNLYITKYQYNMQYNQAKGIISNQEQIKRKTINKTAIDIFPLYL